MKRRPCCQCGRNRAERFFRSERGSVCLDCQKKTRRATARKNHVLRTYGLTPEEHGRLVEYQDGRCAICGGERNYNLAVDHDHQTGLVRGLLCKRDNRLLGQMLDDPTLLRAAADYLESPPALELGIEAKAVNS